jgi:hypothetical protein
MGGGSGPGGSADFGKRPGVPSGKSSGGGGGSAKGDPCDELDEITDLLSPKPDVVKHLHRKQILDLVLTKEEPPILAVTRESKPKVVGSIVPLMLETLLACMEKGRRFEAEVISLAGGSCKLNIRQKPREK